MSRKVSEKHKIPKELIIGEGTFGAVIANNGNAVKFFDKLSSLINEVVVTRYISGESAYFIRAKQYDPNKLTMTMELWHSSLSKALKKGMTMSQRKMVHICILKGKSFLESRYILHADLKLQNILVNSDCSKAIIADFGASSMSNTAKIQCTPNIACPVVPTSHRSHDNFSLVVLTLQLIYNYTFTYQAKTRGQLRNIVRSVVKAPSDAESLCNLIRDQETKCSKACELLYDFYGIKVGYELKDADLVITQNLDLCDLIKRHVGALAKLHKFNKEDRCRSCCVCILSRLDVSLRKKKIYVTTMAFIFACTFEYTSEKDFDKEERMCLSDATNYAKCTDVEIFSALNTILKYKDIITFMFTP
jgi:hypothetical protein